MLGLPPGLAFAKSGILRARPDDVVGAVLPQLAGAVGDVLHARLDGAGEVVVAHVHHHGADEHAVGQHVLRRGHLKLHGDAAVMLDEQLVELVAVLRLLGLGAGRNGEAEASHAGEVLDARGLAGDRVAVQHRAHVGVGGGVQWERGE